MAELPVLAPDRGFGGGALAQTEAFLEAARNAGCDPRLFYIPHPTFGAGRLTLDRIEAIRIVRGSRRLAPVLRAARSAWVVAPLATHGLAAPLSGRPYACWIGTSLAAENAGRLQGIPRSRGIALHLNAPVLARIERRVLRGAAQLYATSPSSRAEIAQAAGLDPSAVGILPLPVDAARFAPEPEERWLARLEAPVVAFVGRPDDPRKNVALALEALPLLRRLIPAVRLRVIGGALEPRDGVEALGEVGSVAAPLREAALLLCTSRQEGFGIAVAEALACGVPVLTTPCGGPEALLRSSGGGRILDGFDATELADAAAGLLRNASTLVAMRRAGRVYVEREHSPARLAALVAAALEELDAGA